MKIIISLSANTLPLATLKGAFAHSKITGEMVRANLTGDNKLVVIYKYVNTMFDKISSFIELAKKFDLGKDAESLVQLGPKDKDMLVVVFDLPGTVVGLDGDLMLSDNVKLSVIRMR